MEATQTARRKVKCRPQPLLAVCAILCSKIADVDGIEVHDVRTWKFVYFRKIFQFLLNNTRDVTRGGNGAHFSWPRITAGDQKDTTMS